MKQKVRAFSIAFFCTIMLICLLCGFAVADSNTRKTGYGDFVPLAQASSTSNPLVYDIIFMGEGYKLSFTWLPKAAEHAQQVQRFLPLRSKAFAMAVFSIAATPF